MTTRRTSQLLILLAALFGVLAFVCACRSHSVAGGSDPGHPGPMDRATAEFPLGPTLEDWMRSEGIPFRVVPFIEAEEETEIPKLSEP